MSVSLASTVTHPATTTENHGKPRSVSAEAMNVDRDELPAPSASSSTAQLPGLEVTNAPASGIPAASTEIKIPGLQVTSETATPPPPASSAPQADERQDENSQRAQAQQAPLSTNPALTRNILSLYGLDPLVATVARTDPVTGEKINKMRKSYEGQLKMFGLSGRNKAVKHDETKGMGLSEMAAWPEEEWQNQKAMGNELTKGLSDAVKDKLGKAMQMQPGRVPNNDFWEDLLGNEKVKVNDPNTKGSKNPATAKPGSQQPNGARLPNLASTTANNAQPNEPIRARRTTKKRRYDDGSFEGYGEGYVDDDMDVGYSSGESRSTRNSAGHRKRRKTKDYTNSPTEYGSRNNSFTAGPVGISAYGR